MHLGYKTPCHSALNMQYSEMLRQNQPFYNLNLALPDYLAPYTTALGVNCGVAQQYKSTDFPFIKCVPAPSAKFVGGKSGHAVFVRVSTEEMGMSSSSLEPYTYLRFFGNPAKNDPVVMFARTPSMILDYKIDDKTIMSLVRGKVNKYRRYIQ